MSTNGEIFLDFVRFGGGKGICARYPYLYIHTLYYTPQAGAEGVREARSGTRARVTERLMAPLPGGAR